MRTHEHIIGQTTIKHWADSHETSDEVAEAILWIAIDIIDAQRIWEDPTEQEFLAVWERATKNGRIDDDILWWGDTTLYSIHRDFIENVR